MITLYSYYRSPASYRVRVALALKDVKYTYKGIHPVKNGGEQHTAEYKTINPQGMVLTLVDGNMNLSQSIAILEYLEEKYPEPALLPKKPSERAFVRQIMMICASDIHPLGTLRVLNYLSGDFGITQAQKTAWKKKWIADGFDALESIISKSPFHTGDYCCGHNITLADISLVPQIYDAHRLEMDMSPWPTLTKIEKKCMEHDCFTKASPEEQPDTPEDQRHNLLKGTRS